MNALLIYFGIVYILIVALMTVRPWLSRKNVIFGVVFSNTEIWDHKITQKTIRRFVVENVVIGLVLAGLFLLVVNWVSLSESNLTQLYLATIFVLFVFEMVPYILANSTMKKLKANLQDENLVKNKITIEVGGAATNKPISALWFLLLLLPIAVTAILAVIYYPGLPEKIATHFNNSGAADAWEVKSVGFIMAPIFNQIVLAALMAMVGLFSRRAPASVKGNPKAAPGYTAFRKLISLFVIAIAFVVETQFLMTELIYLGIVSNMQTVLTVILALTGIFVIVLFIAFFKMIRGNKPSGTVLDDDEKWVLGMFYFNPSDPSVFVEKRSGIGRTVNFGRPAAWGVMAVIVLVIVINLVFAKGA